MCQDYFNDKTLLSSILFALVLSAATANSADLTVDNLVVNNSATLNTTTTARLGTAFYTSRYASLNAAHAAAAAVSGGVIIGDSVNSQLTSTLTTTVPIYMQGGSIQKSGGSLLNVNGPFSAGLSKVFVGFSAGNVTFAAGSVAEIYPQWWEANAVPGATNMTVAAQSAINAGIGAHIPIKFVASTYLITSTLTIYDGTYLVGVTSSQYPDGFGIAPLATTINFTPASVMDLFVYSGYGGNASGFIFHTGISGFYIHGNSTTPSGNSRYALPLTSVIYSRYTDLSINGFQVPVVCTGTINNQFVNISLTGTVSALSYGGVATTDVWTQCSFCGSPIGIQTTGTTIEIRLSHCLFEQLDNYGADIVRETQNMEFDHCYSEDVPFANNVNGAMFRIGLGGSVLTVDNHVTITGGRYAGRNAGTVGSWMSVDYSNGVMINSVNIARYTNVFNTTANTRNTSIVIDGLAGISWATFNSGAQGKLTGVYPNDVINSGSNIQTGTFGTLKATTANITSVTTNNLVAAAGGNYIAPGADNTTSFGLSNLRWTTLYATNGTINTSDRRLKKDILPISDAAIRAWSKVNFVQYRFKDNPKLTHCGVIAQDIIAAFESEGLNALDYGLVSYDKDVYGVNYAECSILEQAYIRSLVVKPQK